MFEVTVESPAEGMTHVRDLAVPSPVTIHVLLQSMPRPFPLPSPASPSFLFHALSWPSAPAVAVESAVNAVFCRPTVPQLRNLYDIECAVAADAFSSELAPVHGSGRCPPPLSPERLQAVCRVCMCV